MDPIPQVQIVEAVTRALEDGTHVKFRSYHWHPFTMLVQVLLPNIAGLE